MAQQASLAHKQSLSPVVTELVTAYQLGTVTKVYSSFKSKMQTGIALNIIGAIVIVGSIVIVGALYILAIDVLWMVFPFILAFGGLCCLIVGISIIVKARRHHTGIDFYVCAEGLVRIDEEQAAVVRWDEVIEVRKVFDQQSSDKAGVIYYLREYCLRRREKQDFILKTDIWLPIDGLCRSIEEYITPLLQSEVMAAYEAGLPVNFGSVEVGERGITLHNGWRTLPWEALKRVDVEQGIINIHKIEVNNQGKRWDTIYLSGMPNPAVFVGLLKNIFGNKVRDDAH